MVYVWGWAVCLVATLLVIACGLRLTRSWKPLWLRDLVRVFAITTLLVPSTAGPSAGFYAPAYIVLIFELMLKDDGKPVEALTALTLAWGAGLIVLAILVIVRRLRAPGT